MKEKKEKEEEEELEEDMRKKKVMHGDGLDGVSRIKSMQGIQIAPYRTSSIVQYTPSFFSITFLHRYHSDGSC